MSDEIFFENSGLSEYRKVEDKLIILYFIDKMDIPLTYNQISHFALADIKMDFFLIQQNIAEMTQSGYLEKFQSDNTERYTITEAGLDVLEYFEKQLPAPMRTKIVKYVTENRKVAKKDYDITANYFYDYSNSEFIVKCGIYEDEAMLMEVNLSVVSREQAQFICANWKENVQHLYADILSKLAYSDS